MKGRISLKQFGKIYREACEQSCDKCFCGKKTRYIYYYQGGIMVGVCDDHEIDKKNN